MPFRLPGARSPSWVLAESVAAAAFSLLSMLVIGRVIGPHATGLGTVAVAAFLTVEVFGAVLFPDALVQLPGLSRRHRNTAVTASVLVGTALSLGLAAAAPLLAERSREQRILRAGWGVGRVVAHDLRNRRALAKRIHDLVRGWPEAA